MADSATTLPCNAERLRDARGHGFESKGPSTACLHIAPLRPEDLAAATAMETSSYPADEAASPEGLAYRLENAGDFFYGCYKTGRSSSAAEFVGFICGTLAAGADLTEESMSQHDPAGDLLCIHSVVVDHAHRRTHIASAMMNGYLKAVHASRPNITQARLLAKGRLLHFYSKICGFDLIGPSPVVHGADLWWDLGGAMKDLAAEPMVQADAFTARPCSGNPVAVVFTHRKGDTQWMQTVANENNLSETAFLEERVGDGANSSSVEYELRWFTPTVEIDLCGHATLGSAHALWETGRVPHGMPIDFYTKSGKLTATRRAGGWIELNFPIDVPTECGEDGLRAQVCAGFGIADEDLVWLGRGKFDVVAQLTKEAFATLQPQMSAISVVKARGVIATTEGRAVDDAPPGATFTSRCFFPQSGVPEDPVTGSAHCTLAAFWANQLGQQQAEMLAYQASTRGGALKVQCDFGAGRVDLRGQATTTVTCKLLC